MSWNIVVIVTSLSSTSGGSESLRLWGLRLIFLGLLLHEVLTSLLSSWPQPFEAFRFRRFAGYWDWSTSGCASEWTIKKHPPLTNNQYVRPAKGPFCPECLTPYTLTGKESQTSSIEPESPPPTMTTRPAYLRTSSRWNEPQHPTSPPSNMHSPKLPHLEKTTTQSKIKTKDKTVASHPHHRPCSDAHPHVHQSQYTQI